jgi:DNA repair protein RadC
MEVENLTLFQGFYPIQPASQKAVREQPDYRVETKADACTVSELLSVIIGGKKSTILANNLLEQFGTIQKIDLAHVNELCSVKGISRITALRLKASLEIGRKLFQPVERRPKITNPREAADILMPLLANRTQEYLMVLLMDTRNQEIDVVEVYHGSLNSTQVRIGEIFKPAIQQNADSIIVFHNHPSGDPSPSSEDISITKAMIDAGKLINICVLDHIIIGTPNKFKSLKESGLISS